MQRTDSDRARTFSLSDFDFALPPELIAQHPTPQRSGSRLLDGTGAEPIDRRFTDLAEQLRAGDLMVFNNTRVMNARLFGHKASGARVELLIERVLAGNQVAAHMRVSKKPKVGATLALEAAPGTEDHPTATLLGRWPDAQSSMFQFVLTNEAGEDPYTIMARHGHVPLPPYITHADTAMDAERYQSVFASRPGAVAAPTASLHFDERVLSDLKAKGVERAHITLHIGAGTFQPVKSENIATHQLHSEWFEVPVATQQAVAACQARAGRVVAVGTTAVRALESWALHARHADPNQTACAYSGDTRIFITPGFSFRVVDMLLTNFHLPKSSLMMLVSAFAGHDHIMALYQHAIAQRYRFFSYGDAMLLARQDQTR